MILYRSRDWRSSQLGLPAARRHLDGCLQDTSDGRSEVHASRLLRTLPGACPLDKALVLLRAPGQRPDSDRASVTLHMGIPNLFTEPSFAIKEGKLISFFPGEWLEELV